MYTNDILILCKGKISNIHVVINLFNKYSMASYHVVSTTKSSIYFGSIPYGRILQILKMRGFSWGTMSFNYLGVPIFKGRVMAYYL